MVTLIRNLLGTAWKTNDSLYFAVLTGCLRISKESIFTGLNNLKVHTISDVRCDEYFGFTDADIFRLWIPNGEIRKLFYELVEDWFRQVTRSDTSRISRFCAAFPAGDTAVRRNRKENFYHGMLHGLLQNQDSWLVKSNAKTGEGYSDISIQTPDRGGIVIELKYADDGNLEKACGEPPPILTTRNPLL